MDLDNLTLKELMQVLDSDDKDSLIDILTKHKDQWNRLQKNINEKIRLHDLDLRNKDLKGLDLSKTIIEGADFSGSDLTGSDFSSAVIVKSNFSDSNLEKARLDYVRISQTKFSGANIYKASLSYTVLTGSVNLFGVYSGKEEDRALYKTHPDNTRADYRMGEPYDGGDEDNSNYRY